MIDEKQPQLFDDEEPDDEPREAQGFGTDPHKLVRTGDPSTSVQAAHKVDSAGLEYRVFNAISTFGPGGCTSDQIRALPEFAGAPYSSVTARYRALLDKGLIEVIGTRDGISGSQQRIFRRKD